MDNQKRAISWLLINSDQFKIKIESLNWIKNIFPNWTDILCRAEFGSKKIEAWGASLDEDEALCKAFAETAERGVFFEEGSENTNGFAAHINIQDAQKNAALELQERDLFLCHFLTKTPFFKINNHIIKNWNWVENVLIQAKKMNLNLHYYHLGTSGTLCVIDGLNLNPQFGYIIGSSFKEDLSMSAISATIEAFRRAYIIVHEKKSDLNLNLDQFNKLDHVNFKHHGLLSLNIEYTKLISFLFPEVESDLNFKYPYHQLEWNNFKQTELFWPYNLSNDQNFSCPFFFSKAYGDDFQRLFLGNNQLENINLKRLNQFLNFQNELNLTDLINYPHPFN